MAWFRLFRRAPRNVASARPTDESYARMLLLGEAEPPSDFMRNPKLDEALQRYRDEIRRQKKQTA